MTEGISAKVRYEEQYRDVTAYSLNLRRVVLGIQREQLQKAKDALVILREKLSAEADGDNKLKLREDIQSKIALIMGLESETLRGAVEENTKLADRQSRIASSYQSQLSSLQQMAESVQAPPEMRIRIATKEYDVAKMSLEAAKLNLEGIKRSMPENRPAIIAAETAVVAAQSAMINKMAYARRSWLEGFTATTLGIGGIRSTLTPTLTPEATRKGPGWYEGAITEPGYTGGRNLGRTWQETYTGKFGAPWEQRTVVERIAGATLEGTEKGLSGANFNIYLTQGGMAKYKVDHVNIIKEGLNL